MSKQETASWLYECRRVEDLTTSSLHLIAKHHPEKPARDWAIENIAKWREGQRDAKVTLASTKKKLAGFKKCLDALTADLAAMQKKL